MMQFGNMSGWWMAFMWVGSLIIIGFFIWFIVTIVVRTTNNNQLQLESALDVLKRRYAHGEISKEEYGLMSKDLLY